MKDPATPTVVDFARDIIAMNDHIEYLGIYVNHIPTLAQKIAVIAHNCQHKEPDQLTDQEQIALAILGGAAWEMTETGVRVTDAFGIVKNDGKFHVAIRKP